MRGAPGCLHGFPCSGLPCRAGVCHQGLYVSTSGLLCPGPGPAALTLSSAAHRAQADGRGRVGHPSRGDGEGARPPLQVHRDSRPVSHCPCGHLKSTTRDWFLGAAVTVPQTGGLEQRTFTFSRPRDQTPYTRRGGPFPLEAPSRVSAASALAVLGVHLSTPPSHGPSSYPCVSLLCHLQGHSSWI